MKLLMVSRLERSARAINTIAKYVQTGTALGHEVAMFAERNSEFPSMPYSLDVDQFDFVVFVIYETADFPDLPYLARVLDGMPKERRVIIDCTGRFNETIRVEHDYNHLEKLDGHQGWEWVEGFQAVSDRVLQPTLAPRRADARPFLFFGYDPAATTKSYTSACEAAKSWASTNGVGREYGLAYVGNNWQRWTQMKRFLEAIEPLKDRLGPIAFRGWAWDERPQWAAEHGFGGLDLDPALLQRLGVGVGSPISFDEVVEFQGKARFCPVIHRPLFNELGLVTNRTFETFSSDTLPILLFPESIVESVLGKDALPLAAGNDVRGKVEDMLRRPDIYWDAVLKTRAHLAAHHSYEQRFKELQAIIEN
jgi:hypothetical protein